MLTSLYIKNYILIDEIKIDFNKGLSVITGETGAGKSIIIDALSLLFGKRADTSVIRKNQDKCIIEAIFDIQNLKLENLFSENEIDYLPECTLRREISSNGKSRIFINDCVTNLSALRTISENIFFLHSQNENLSLANPIYRLNIVDTIANNQSLLECYQNNFHKLEEIRTSLRNAKSELEKLSKESDYNQFQAEQLVAAKLDSDSELESLENQQLLLENAEEIKNNLLQIHNFIENDEVSINIFIKDIKNSLQKISKIYKPANEYLERIEYIKTEFQDINQTITQENEKIENNPQVLEEINQRIDLINSLLLKHHVKDIIELKQKRDEYLSLIKNTEEIENKISDLEKAEKKQFLETLSIAKKLSENRKNIFPKIEKYIVDTISELGINYGIFKVEDIISETLTESGIDNINFLFSANKSIEPELLDKVASGGEFSRLMLTINSLIANSIGFATIIFDEIDTGVSGEIANKMGKIMKKISQNTQVISITHLPQVAAIGDFHYKVFKYTDEYKTISGIKQINEDERITEIASMISGEKLTPQAIENARILLE